MEGNHVWPETTGQQWLRSARCNHWGANVCAPLQPAASWRPCLPSLIMTRSRPEARPAWGDPTPGSPALSATFSTSQRGWRAAPLKDVRGAADPARVSGGGGLMDLSQPCSFAVELLFSLPLSQLHVFPAPCQCWIIYTDRKRKLSLSQSQGSPLTHLSHGQMSPVHYLWGVRWPPRSALPPSFICC